MSRPTQMAGMLCECSRPAARRGLALQIGPPVLRSDAMGQLPLDVLGALVHRRHRSVPEFSPRQDRTRARSLDDRACGPALTRARGGRSRPPVRGGGGGGGVSFGGQLHSSKWLAGLDDCTTRTRGSHAVCGCDGRQSECSECIFFKSHCPADRDAARGAAAPRALGRLGSGCFGRHRSRPPPRSHSQVPPPSRQK